MDSIIYYLYTGICSRREIFLYNEDDVGYVTRKRHLAGAEDNIMPVKFTNERNKVGVDDLVMLDQISEDALLSNLEKRYKDKYIYTSIGRVLISLNPYTDLQLTTPAMIKKYHEEDNFHIPPHIFTLANDAYRALHSENESQAIIISGESGAGKTEASKGIMQYLAAITGKSGGARVDKVKEVVLQSNPLLESFGNAKTLRNNNSSRFGKYIEIQFDYKGEPEGGRVRNYLLEKSRVCAQIPNERSFHIFYQLFHLSDQEKDKFNLKGKTSSNFQYLNKSNCSTADGIDDKNWLNETLHAMSAVGVTSNERDDILSLLSGVLHLGNITFSAKGNGSTVSNRSDLEMTAKLLSVDVKALESCLTARIVSAGTSGRASVYNVAQTPAQAEATRDAFSKNIYGKLFDWFVEKINVMIDNKQPGKNIGILDIYGFEIFQTNSFEQLCINFCNESLHQIFIDLTLKTEQEEYVREGIKWEPVAFINNKPCVELLNNKPMGVFCILDEECLLDNTDKHLLQKLNTNFSKHSHYEAGKDMKTKDSVFTVRHYAGDVPYTIDDFLEKNRDTLFADVKDTAAASRNNVLVEIFNLNVGGEEPVAPPQGRGPFSKGAKSRPTTAGAQFKKSMAGLLQTLYSCQPHYIRCIKPNEQKKALGYDSNRVKEQVKYLGLLENLKVARAGFCYRQTYEKWFERYYFISKHTFPKFKGTAREAVELLVKEELKLNPNEYQFGKT
ncbi:myosin IA heavy chain, partial [Planoprotostelium fungivorum]